MELDTLIPHFPNTEHSCSHHSLATCLLAEWPGNIIYTFAKNIVMGNCLLHCDAGSIIRLL